jgi:LCP family protein required for cell wall assembly
VEDGLAGLDGLLGEDGRLTVLLLGTDARKDIAGERTDAIIVATIDPFSGRVTMVSLPRDTVNVPTGPDRVYPDRINTLYGDHLQDSGKPSVALRKTRQALAYAFDTEIDFHALIDFNGLVRLIDSVGGVDVTLEESLVDPTMHVGQNGLKLKAGERHLDGKHALAFSRSRHTDSDYERSRRQQQVIAAAARAVRDRGASALPGLVALVDQKMTTDIPLSAAPALLALAGRARLDAPKSVVLAPSRFAGLGTVEYTTELRVDEVRRMFDRAFGPVDPGG